MGRKIADSLSEFLGKYALYICLVLVVIIAIVVLLLLFVSKKKSKPKINYEDWLIALGGKENVKEVTAVGSRLSLVLVDKEKANRDELTKLGVSSVLTMSGKLVLVIEDKAEQIAESIRSYLN